MALVALQRNGKAAALVLDIPLLPQRLLLEGLVPGEGLVEDLFEGHPWEGPGV